VDESETGSANFFGVDSHSWASGAELSRLESRSMHLRLPSIDRGITSFLWALGFGLYIWLGLLAIGVGKGTALMLALLSFGAIFLLVRIYGEQA